jgi:hypothetical protein
MDFLCFTFIVEAKNGGQPLGFSPRVWYAANSDPILQWGWLYQNIGLGLPAEQKSPCQE